MFGGDYSFFDYKYNIAGYTGQDFGSIAQYLYLVVSVILLVILLSVFRNTSHARVLKVIRTLSIFFIVFYIVKTSWETIYDIMYTGSFNTGLLPLDVCSMIMPAGIISGFCKGKIREYSDAWIATGCVIGGIATMFFLNALKFYPFFSFGAFYSMIWHFLMVFLGLLLIITNYVDINYKTVIKGFLFHLLISCFVIPIDFVFKWDFMMYRSLGGIPVFEDIAKKFMENGLIFLNPIMMLVLYFIAYNVEFAIPLLINMKRKIRI